MARRSAANGQPPAAPRPKGTARKTTPAVKTTPRPTTKTGPVETSMTKMGAALRKTGPTTPATEVLIAQAVALAATIDFGVREGNAYAVQSASKELSAVLDKLTRDNPTPDAIDALIANIAGGPAVYH